MKYLLDTNILSEHRKGGRANVGVMEFFANAPDGDLCTSALVIGELRVGVERLRLRDPASAHVLEVYLTRAIIWFEDRILPVDAAAAEQWAVLTAKATLPPVDGLIAATALTRELTIVTRNTRDFERTGVQLVNPFTD